MQADDATVIDIRASHDIRCKRYRAASQHYQLASINPHRSLASSRCSLTMSRLALLAGSPASLVGPSQKVRVTLCVVLTPAAGTVYCKLMCALPA